MDPSSGPAFKKRKKGIPQRVHEAREEQHVKSDLLSLLMKMYAKGLLSGEQVHAIAKAGQADVDKAAAGFDVQGLRQVATLAQSRNLARQIAATLSNQCALPMPMEV